MTARFVRGDNLDVMRALRADGERYHLVYIDPPFFTGRDFKMDGEFAFSDRWPSLDAYLGHLHPRFEAARGLLAPEGNMVVHVSPDVSHHVRIVLDRVFGSDCWCDEIVWRYRRWPAKTRRCQRVHDVLLRYAIDPKRARWTQLYDDLAPSTLETWGRAKQQAVVVNGARVRSQATEKQSPGVPVGDVWDIGIIAPMSSERTGYPTQKPERLIERVVRAFSAVGDSVLDPTCGSGTTLAVAARLGRHATGIDASAVAERVARERILGCAAVDVAKLESAATTFAAGVCRVDERVHVADAAAIAYRRRSERRAARRG